MSACGLCQLLQNDEGEAMISALPLPLPLPRSLLRKQYNEEPILLFLLLPLLLLLHLHLLTPIPFLLLLIVILPLLPLHTLLLFLFIRFFPWSNHITPHSCTVLLLLSYSNSGGCAYAGAHRQDDCCWPQSRPPTHS